MELSQTNVVHRHFLITSLFSEINVQHTVSAKIKIPRGKIVEFKEATADYIKQVKEKDTGTLQADWFLSSDGTECEIREAYEDSEAISLIFEI